MTWTLAQIWRHPIKGIGVEALDQVRLSAGLPLPLDRAWAVLEEGHLDQEGWRSCNHFIRGAKGPSLMAVTCQTTDESLILRHPDRPDLTLDLSAFQAASEALVAWLGPIYPETRAAPAKLVPSPAQGMTDTNFASLSVLGRASLDALSEKLGQALDPRRFRGNFWLDGLAPFEEFSLVGKTIAIGDATLEIVEQITRCRATEVNPLNGIRDAGTLRALQDHWGHTDFGVYARVLTGGDIAIGNKVITL